MVHPDDQGLEPLGRGAVIDIAALGALGDETRLFQGLQVLLDSALSHAATARQLGDANLLALEHALEHGSAGRIGKGAHHCGDGIGGGIDHEYSIRYY